MKGIILAGGVGSRLHPMTLAVSKQLLPVFDKPMIYYPLSTLMLAGIRDILIITTGADQGQFKRLLQDGGQFGLRVSYAVQDQPRGIADAFLISREFIGREPISLILGDNIFFGHGLSEMLLTAAARKSGATVFAYAVRDPQRYGVVELDASGCPISIQEKPREPKSNLVITGLYFYDNEVIDIAASLKPSGRGELEITDVNRVYLERGRMHVELMGRGFAWLDTGTPKSLLDASKFMQILEERQGMRVAAPEEIALHAGWIKLDQFIEQANKLEKSDYGQYLLRIAKDL